MQLLQKEKHLKKNIYMEYSSVSKKNYFEAVKIWICGKVVKKKKKK